MKKALVLTALLLLRSAAMFAQENQSVLWEISGKGLEKPSYLFGTYHIASITLLDSFPRLMRIAENCDFAVFESGGSHIGDIPAPTESTQPPLDSLFTPGEYAIVDSFFTASPHGSIRPHNKDADLWSMLQVALTVQEGGKNIQYDPFDHLLMQKMRELNKPIFQLDDPEEVDNLVNGLGYRNIARMLVTVINEKAALKNHVPAEAVALALYSETLRNPLKLDQDVDKELGNATIDRNAHWLPKIENKMREGNCLIAIGFKHLQYKTGLIQLLKNQGYSLKPVNL
jgi:uncharacterized protein YbaP (TraB family)